MTPKLFDEKVSGIKSDDENALKVQKEKRGEEMKVNTNDNNKELKKEMSNSKIHKKDNYYYSDQDIMGNVKKVNSVLNNTIIDEEYEIKDLFLIDNPEENSHVIDNKIWLKGDPVSIVCQNINFYMGGTANIWEKSGKSIGVEMDMKEEKKLRQSIGVGNTQAFNDKKLEFFTYENGITIGMEKVITGLADKIYSGDGPILINFKDTPGYSEKDKFNRIFMNIDGEYYNIIKPISLRIRNNTKIFNGQIPFLKYNKEQK